MADWDMVLTVAGTDYDLDARIAAMLFIDSWGWDLDDDGSLEWHELSDTTTTLLPRWSGATAVSLAVEIAGDPVVVFSGIVTDAQPHFDDTGIGYGYRARGFKFLGNTLPVVAVDGTATMAFNLSPLDDDYLEAEAGLELGTIIDQVLTQHAAALTALGITADATTTAQLAALTLVPPEPVFIAGSELLKAIETALQQWARNYVLFIGGDGLIRFLDATAGTPLSLTYGTDPINYPLFSRDWSNCATAVQVVGQGKIFPAYISLSHSDLARAWTSTDQTGWKFDDFAKPKGAFCEGAVTTVGSATSVTVDPTDNALTWALNYWSDNKAWIYLKKAIGTGLTYQEARPVTGCAALTAAGTSAISLGFDLENAGSTAYDTFTLIGNPALLGAGGLNSVWRLYGVTDPGSLVADHLVKQFPTPVPFANFSGTATVMTNFPQALIVKGGITYPATFKVLPLTGQILFDQPVPAGYTTQANLNTGGASVAAPDDIYCMLAYSRGALTATKPASGYEGTAYTVDGLERTKVIPVDSWTYAGNQSMMEDLAQMYLDSCKDTVLSGSISHIGLLDAVLAPSVLLSVSSSSGTTGYESLGVPVRAVRYDLADDGKLSGKVDLRCSSRRNPRTGDRYYLHPTQLGQIGFKLNLGEGIPDFRGLAGSLPDASAGLATRQDYDPSEAGY